MSKYIDAEAFKRRILSYGTVHEGDHIQIPFYKHYFAKAYVAMLRWVCEEVDDTPAVDIPRWIPVTDGLPEIDNNLDGIRYLYPFLVTRYSSINPDRTKYDPYVAEHYFDGEDFFNLGGEVRSEYVIAWMPLPEPYKGGEEE